MNSVNATTPMHHVHANLTGPERDVLFEEAAAAGVDEGRVIVLALTLLATVRSETTEGGGVFVGPDLSKPLDELSLIAQAVAAPELGSLTRSQMRSTADRYRLAIDTISGDEVRHLRPL